MDAASHMTVTTGNGVEALECLSRGTMDQIYFAIRMAAGELLCEEESLPVILDDIFGMYDEEDLKQSFDGCTRKKNRSSSVPAINARWRFWTERESLMRNYF